MAPEGKGMRVRASEKVPGAPLEKSGALLLGRGSLGACCLTWWERGLGCFHLWAPGKVSRCGKCFANVCC